MGLPISGEFIARENSDRSAVKRSRTRRWPCLSAGLVCLLAIAAAHASDNSNSTLEVFALLANEPQQVAVGTGGGHTVTAPSGVTYTVSLPGEDVIKIPGGGSSPISDTPPPPISGSALGLSVQGGKVVPTPPSPQALKQQLAAQEQELAEQQAGLAQAQSTLAIFQGQVNQFCSTPSLDYSAENCAEAQSFVATWTTAVQTDQNLVAKIQAQIAQLQAQIPAQ